MGWFSYALLSTLFLALAYTLFKLPALRKLNRFVSTFWTNLFMALFAILASIIFDASSFRTVGTSVLLISLLWGLFFSLNMFFQMKALDTMQAGALFPLASALSTLLVVSIAIFFLGDSVSLLKVAGVILVIVAIYFFTQKEKAVSFDKDLILLFLGIIVSSVLVKFTQKIAIGVAKGKVLALMPFEHTAAALFSLLFAFLFYRNWHKVRSSLVRREEWGTASIIAIPLFLGGYFLISALSAGEASRVFAIHPIYAAFVALFSAILFRERLTLRKLLLILLMVLGVILIKVG